MGRGRGLRVFFVEKNAVTGFSHAHFSGPFFSGKNSAGKRAGGIGARVWRPGQVFASKILAPCAPASLPRNFGLLGAKNARPDFSAKKPLSCAPKMRLAARIGVWLVFCQNAAASILAPKVSRAPRFAALCVTLKKTVAASKKIPFLMKIHKKSFFRTFLKNQ